MKEKTKITLEKMRGYCQKVIDYTKGMDYLSFSNDSKTQEACIFNLSQIGELVQQLDSDFINQFDKINWQGVRGLRNRIVHDYEGLKINIIWQLKNEDLLELLNYINSILQ